MCSSDLGEGVLDEPVFHLAARRDKAAGPEREGPQREDGLRPGDRLGLSQLFVLYDEGDYPHPGELRALLHGGVRVPRGYHQLVSPIEGV